MPFPEMPAMVARLGQQMSNRNLLRPQRIARIKGAVAVGVPPGQNTAARGRARGVTGIKMIKPQTGTCHFIEHGRLEMWVAIVTGFRPAMVITHQEDDVRFVCCWQREHAQAKPEKKRSHGQSKQLVYLNRKHGTGKAILCYSVRSAIKLTGKGSFQSDEDR